MNPKRLLATVAGAAMLATVPVALTATSAEAATSIDTRVVIGKTSSVYTYGSVITISGSVQGNHPTQGWGTLPDTAGGKVALYRKVQPYSSWKWVATDSSEGTFSFRTKAYANSTYRVVYNGGTQGDFAFKATSNWRAIKSRRDAAAKIVKSGSRLYMQGNVNPGWEGKSVKIVRSRYSKGTYATYKWVRTNKYGAYKASVVAPSSGRYYYRVIIPASSPTFVQTTSPTWYTYKSY